MRDIQEDFNKAFLGLKSQGFHQALDHLTCVLLDDEGRRCAIGWVLGADVPRERGNARSDALFAWADTAGTRFYSQLRYAHDISSGPEDMERRLLRVADLYGLTVPAERGDLLDELVREWTTEDPGFPEKLRRAEADRKQTTKEKTDDA